MAQWGYGHQYARNWIKTTNSLTKCCLPLPSPNGNQCLALGIHEQSDNTILDVHMLVRKKKWIREEQTSLSSLGGVAHIIEKHLFNKIMGEPVCPFNCMLGLVMMCLIFLVH